MNTTSPNPADSPAELRADQQFRAFFHTQLPDPFPALVLPPDAPEPVRPAARRSLLVRSRIVLAVCVSLILVILGSLRGQLSVEPPKPASPDSITATPKKDPIKPTRP